MRRIPYRDEIQAAIRDDEIQAVAQTVNDLHFFSSADW
jgi:hypothetical protein